MNLTNNTIQEKKLAVIRKQITDLEQKMKERSGILEQIQVLHAAEQIERENRVLDTLKHSHFLIDDEMKQVYGSNAYDKAVKNYTRDPNKYVGKTGILEDIINSRTKAFSLSQQEKALQIKHLNDERQRLQAARDRVRDQRKALNASPADNFRSEPNYLYRVVSRESAHSVASSHSIHTVDSYIRKTVENLSQNVDKIWRLREEVDKDYRRVQKPYNGRLGIQSYKPWQLADYWIVRGLVEQEVEKFLINYIKPGNSHLERDTVNAIIDAENKDRRKTEKYLIESRATQLILEEIVLQVTGSMARETTMEMFHLFGLMRNMTDTMMMTQPEIVSTEDENGRQPTDPAYNIITRGYYGHQRERNAHRSDIWGHTQHLHLMADTDDRIEEDDPDIALIHFHHITPVDMRHYEPARLDAQEIAEEKERYKKFLDFEILYWQGMMGSVTSIGYPKKCVGISMVEASPDHTLLAVGMVHGDMVIYDTSTGVVPWPPIRVLNNESPVRDSLIHIAWSLDNSKLVTVNKLGTLHLWSLDGGVIKKSDIKSLGIKVDKQGVVPQQLVLKASLDYDNEDFIFQEGPFADQGIIDDNYRPMVAAFIPPVGKNGDQPSVIVSLENGDILRLNVDPQPVEEPIAQLPPSSHNRNGNTESRRGTTNPPALASQPGTRTASREPGNPSPSSASQRPPAQGVLPLSSANNSRRGSQGSPSIPPSRIQQPSESDPDNRPTVSQLRQRGSRQTQQGSGPPPPPDDTPPASARESRLPSPLVNLTQRSPISAVSRIDNSEPEPVNAVGQGIEAELFRQHKATIIYLGFLEGLQTMVSVDVNGHIFLWNQKESSKTGYGWFGAKKYRLDMSKIMYSVSTNTKPNIVFTDKVKVGSKGRQKTRQDIAKERDAADADLETLRLGDPWHEETLQEQHLTTSIYAPRDSVRDNGALFHVVIRHLNTQQLSTYITRMYKPVKVRCGKLMCCSANPSGSHIAFVLLFPEYPPKGAHLTIVYLDLHTMTLRYFRRDIYLSNTEFRECLQEANVHCSVTSVHTVTGTDYLFIVYKGSVHVMSLKTGKSVLKTASQESARGFKGLLLSPQTLQLSKLSRLCCFSREGSIYMIAYDDASCYVKILRIKDDNTEENKKTMKDAARLCPVVRDFHQ